MSVNRNTVMCWASSVLRLFLCGLALISGSIGLTDSRSLAYLAAGSDDGRTLTIGLMALAAVGVVDVLLNDIVHPALRCATTMNLRHFGYLAMAFCYVAQLFVAHAVVRSPGLSAYYLWNAGAIMFVAFWDASLRSKDAACKLARN